MVTHENQGDRRDRLFFFSTFIGEPYECHQFTLWKLVKGNLTKVEERGWEGEPTTQHQLQEEGSITDSSEVSLY